MSSKRKRVVLSIETKYEIIQKLKNGSCATNLAKKYGVAKGTITGIKNNEAAIVNYLRKKKSSDVSRKSLKLPENTQLDNAVYQWILQCRKNGVPVTGPLICEKALELNNKLKGNVNFKASNGWLAKFKLRHGIREMDVSGNKLSTDKIPTGTLKVNFNKFIIDKGYELKNTYNENDKTLIRKGLSQKKTSVSRRKKSVPSRKSMIALCGNIFEEVPSHLEAFNALKKVLKWSEAQKECNCAELCLLKQLCDLAAIKIRNS